MSLIQSPKRFNDMTASDIAIPGKVAIHQNPAKRYRPSDTMEPDAAVGGETGREDEPAVNFLSYSALLAGLLRISHASFSGLVVG